ncbi:hypothetical protein JOM56_008052 [Amanita muscaria]
MPPKKARAASSKASTSRKTSVVTEDQVVELTKTLKPRAKGKGKGKAKQQEEPDEDEEGEDQENEGKESGDDEEDEDDFEEGARVIRDLWGFQIPGDRAAVQHHHSGGQYVIVSILRAMLCSLLLCTGVPLGRTEA